MPIVRCTCGARYNVPASAAGRHARCKKCGQVIDVPTEPAGAPPAEALAELSALAAGTTVAQATPVDPAGAVQPGTPAGATTTNETMPTAAAAGGAAARAQALGGFFKAVGRSFLFPLRRDNLVTFAVLWVILAASPLLAFAFCFAWIGMLLIQGWYMAFLLNVVLDAASGEEDLTQPALSGNWFDDLVVPCFKFFVTGLVIRVPAFAYLFFVQFPQKPLLQVAAQLLPALMLGGVTRLLDDAPSGHVLTYWGLLAAGEFLWPMVVLVVAVGGGALLVRPDLMLVTIVKTFGGYVCAVVLAFASLAIPRVYSAIIADPGDLTFSGFLFVTFLVKGLEIYATIVAMRVIGLYYRHFKRGFAWAWD